MEIIGIITITALYFVMSIFGSMFGSAGLITVPVLLLFGLSPHVALGTHKFGAVGVSAGGAYGYYQKGQLKIKQSFIFLITALLGAIVGVTVVISLDAFILEKIIGAAIVIMVLFLLFKNNSHTIKKNNKNKFAISLFTFISGIYNGFFGGGIGVVNRFVFLRFFSYTYLQSSAISAFINVGGNLFAMILFFANGFYDITLIAPIFIASIIGSQIGSRYAVKLGNNPMQNLFIFVALIMAVKLLFF